MINYEYVRVMVGVHGSHIVYIKNLFILGILNSIHNAKSASDKQALILQRKNSNPAQNRSSQNSLLSLNIQLKNPYKTVDIYNKQIKAHNITKPKYRPNQQENIKI